MIVLVRRWWPIPVAVVAAVILQQLFLTSRYDVRGHAGEHLGSASFVFLAMVVAGVLLWTTPVALRSPIVLVGLAIWLGAGVAVAVGNVRVVDVLIDSGQAHTPNDLVRDSAALTNAHDLANTAPLLAVLGAMVVTFGVFRARAVSGRVAAVAAGLNILVPYWVVPGFGVVVLAGVRVVARERAARVPAAAR